MPKPGLWGAGVTERNVRCEQELKSCWRCFKQSGRQHVLRHSSQPMSPECMAGVCEIGWFAPVLPAAAWGDLCWWRYVEEQDLGHPSSSGQGLFPTGQCPSILPHQCMVGFLVQKCEYRKEHKHDSGWSVPLLSSHAPLEKAAGHLGQ